MGFHNHNFGIQIPKFIILILEGILVFKYQNFGITQPQFWYSNTKIYNTNIRGNFGIQIPKFWHSHRKSLVKLTVYLGIFRRFMANLIWSHIEQYKLEEKITAEMRTEENMKYLVKKIWILLIRFFSKTLVLYFVLNV